MTGVEPGDPAAAVRKLLIDGHGIAGAKLHAGARLLHDLGIDGDDAGAVFQGLHAQFGTDFTELDRQWRRFFGTEGFSLRTMLFATGAVLVCGGAAGALAGILHWPRAPGLGLALALLVGAGWVVARWRSPALQPVTVGGLIAIVRAGRWPTDPTEVR